MKDNNVPRVERLRARIRSLEWKLDQSSKPMNEIHGLCSNPYWGCTDCGRADPELSYAGHYKTCKFKGLNNEIRYYSNLIEDELRGIDQFNFEK